MSVTSPVLPSKTAAEFMSLVAGSHTFLLYHFILWARTALTEGWGIKECICVAQKRSSS